MGYRARWKSFFAFLCCLLCLSACQKSVEQQIAEQLELAQKYLVELKYEEAAIAFQKVIELDPKQLPAYQGLGEVYLAQAEQKENEGQLEDAEVFYGQAMQIFEKILELDPENSEASERLSVLFSKVSNLEDLLNVLEQMPEENEVLEEWQMAVQFLKNLIELLENGDYETVLSIIRGTEYLEFCDWFIKEKSCIWKMESEKGIGFYPIENQVMIYYGDYNGQNREGYGTWIGLHENKQYDYLAEGEWNENLPNGYQKEIYENHIGKNNFNEGMVENGLWNGTMEENYWISNVKKNKTSFDTSSCQFIQGKLQILYYEEGHYDNDDPFGSAVYYENEDFACSIDTEDVNKLYGILGFGEMWW